MNIRHRRWFKQANGPLPDPLPKINKGCCPAYKKLCLSCSHYPHGIWLNKWDWGHRRTLYHEIGHWFDVQHLTDTDREAIREHFGWTGPWWWPPSWDPESIAREPNCERFARSYAQMLLHPRQFKWLRRLCREARDGI